MKLWGQVIQMEPQNAQNYYKRFRVFLRQNKLKEALNDLNKALQIKPDFDSVLLQRGKLHIRLGRCEEAERDLLQIRSLGKDVESTLMEQASACRNHVAHAHHYRSQNDFHNARQVCF